MEIFIRESLFDRWGSLGFNAQRAKRSVKWKRSFDIGLATTVTKKSFYSSKCHRPLVIIPAPNDSSHPATLGIAAGGGKKEKRAAQ